MLILRQHRRGFDVISIEKRDEFQFEFVIGHIERHPSGYEVHSACGDIAESVGVVFRRLGFSRTLHEAMQLVVEERT